MIGWSMLNERLPDITPPKIRYMYYKDLYYLIVKVTIYYIIYIGGVMVGVLASSVVDHGLNPCWVKPKTIKMVFFLFIR